MFAAAMITGSDGTYTGSSPGGVGGYGLTVTAYSIPAGSSVLQIGNLPAARNKYRSPRACFGSRRSGSGGKWERAAVLSQAC